MVINYVVSGISGRFAESDNTDELWHNLINNIDMVNDDHRKWPPGIVGIPRRTGKLKGQNHAKFDASFFEFSDDHANETDPSLRILHEVIYEAILDSGNDPDTWRGRKIGVFVANDFVELYSYNIKNETNARHMSAVGAYRPMLANNISYFFDFRGPSVVLTTGCSSGGAALDMAIMNMEKGVCESAIIAGCHLSLNPLTNLSEYSRRYLSLDGNVKFMDESANGYARSEVVSAMLIQPETIAKRIYATILATHVTYDGYRPNRYAPNSDAMSDYIKETLVKADISAKEIRFVECHGTGTELGDRAEVNAIVKGVCDGRNEPVMVSSVKTNMGHAECGAVFTSMAKVILSFENGTIPASLHLSKVSPEFEAYMNTKIVHVGKNTRYENGSVLIISFGIGGADAFVLLEPHEKHLHRKPIDKCHRIIPVFSRSKDGIVRTIDQFNQLLANNRITVDFLTLYYEIANVKNMPYRGYVIFEYDKVDKVNSIVSHYAPRHSKKKNIIYDLRDINMKIYDLDKLIHLRPFMQSYNNSLWTKLDLIDDSNDFDIFINSLITGKAIIDFLQAVNIRADDCIANTFVGHLLSAYVNRDLNDEHILIIARKLSKNFKQNIDSKPMKTFLKENFALNDRINSFVAKYLAELDRSSSDKDNAIIIDFSGSQCVDYRNNVNDCYQLFNDNDLYSNLLSLLGRLYESDVDIEWNALYATSGHFPVSRGTQSIAPLIQWDHSIDYFFPKYTDFINFNK